jgi:hypothetical protein
VILLEVGEVLIDALSGLPWCCATGGMPGAGGLPPWSTERRRGMRHTAEYVGGPLDGRCEPLPPTKSFVGNIVTHIFLHGGPKIETRYRLDRTEEGRWIYRLLGDAT